MMDDGGNAAGSCVYRKCQLISMDGRADCHD